MISHFWNLCRACPAVDVDKLHSEYRSTYRWYEYTPKQENQVVRKPPQPITHSGIDGAEFPRKKKHPEIAYKSHDFFDPNAATPKRASRQAERESSSAPQRRSQSEGPVTRNPLFQSEYRLQFANARKSREKYEKTDESRSQSKENKESKAFISYPPPAASSTWNRKQNSLKSQERSSSSGVDEQDAREPKKSVSMGQIQQKAAKQPAPGAGDESATDGAPSSTQNSREYKSEYKNKYRPFSQYEYVGDGKFLNTSSSPLSEIDGQSNLTSLPKQKKERLEGEPWYKEVQELRKAANDYKCRGWGTDIVNPAVSQLYSQQLNLHEQAAKRESLSALALAISTPRSMKGKCKDRKGHKFSPTSAKLGRPKSSSAKLKKSHSRPESAQACTNKDGISFTPCGSPSKIAVDADKENSVKTNDVSKISKRQKPGEFKRKLSKSNSRATSREQSRPPSAIDSQIDYFREPVVKSPPEPTRVKSPEQLLIRSPDPINWTVPLDTGKTFSVTQSVRDTDSARNSPMSDHSSHFDSVSGTAINLGNYAINEKGSLQYPKVSALAREAKELTGIKNKEENDSDASQKNQKEEADSVEQPKKCFKPAEVENGCSAEENGKSEEPSEKPNEEPIVKPSVEPPLVQPIVEPPTLVQPVVETAMVKPVVEPPMVNPVVEPSIVTPEVKTDKEEKAGEGSSACPNRVENEVKTTPKNSPYKVLEDPGMMTTSLYMPFTD